MTQAEPATLAPLDRRLLWSGGELGDKVQYACGRNAWEGWVNTDFFDETSFPTGEPPEELFGTVYHVDLTKRHPFPSNHFRVAYSEDFIEHISQEESINFLLEVLRCLQPGGTFRVSTPGLHGVLDRHYYRVDFERAQSEHYQCFRRWGHRHFFTHESLRAVAHALGFSRYREVTFGRSELADLKGVDTRHEQVEFNIIAELTK
jgi:predicted SAM-dependent methyltransferase